MLIECRQAGIASSDAGADRLPSGQAAGGAGRHPPPQGFSDEQRCPQMAWISRRKA
jgi:hypothetical protein